LNRAPGENEMTAFRCVSNCDVAVPEDADSVIVATDRVVRRGSGPSVSLGSEETLLAARGNARPWLAEQAKKGTVDLAIRIEAKECKATDIVGAGPRLVRGGKPDVGTEEGFAHEKVRHPRTAVALTASGKILFVAVDGRQPRSQGMRLDELAEELVRLGAVEAMNLDGGGSTTMAVRGVPRNVPSDGIERPVGDAILIYSVESKEQLADLEGRLLSAPRKLASRILDEARLAIQARVQ